MAERIASIHGMPAPTRHQIQEGRRTQAQAATNLDTVRRSAETWRNAGLISAGLAVAGSIVAGPELIKGLPAQLRLLVLVLTGIAYLAGLVSTGLSVRASMGWPRMVRTASPTALQDWERREIRVALSSLRASMWLAAVVAVFAGAAIGIALAVPEPQMVKMTTAHLQVCGSIHSQTKTAVTIDSAGALIEIPKSEIRQMTQLQQCSG